MLEEDPDCHFILTDYQMPPGINGLEFSSLVDELYARLAKPSPFIALCSADYSSSLYAQCAEHGVEGKYIAPCLI